MLAVEMHQDIGSYAAKALEQGLLINVTRGKSSVCCHRDHERCRSR